MTKKKYVTPSKGTTIPVKMVSPKRAWKGKPAEPPILCSLCGKFTHMYVIRVTAKLELDICYICVEDINNATMYDTYCLQDECGEPIPIPARVAEEKE